MDQTQIVVEPEEVLKKRLWVEFSAKFKDRIQLFFKQNPKIKKLPVVYVTGQGFVWTTRKMLRKNRKKIKG